MILQNVVPLVTKNICESDILSILDSLQKRNLSSLLLDSPGGCISGFVQFEKSIIKRNISTIGMNRVESLAFDIFLCGKKRFATPGTSFFIHEGRALISGRTVTESEAQMKALIFHQTGDKAAFRNWLGLWQALVYINQISIDLMSKRTKISKGMIGELMYQNHRFNIEEALNWGIIHDVVQSDQIHMLPQFGIYSPW